MRKIFKNFAMIALSFCVAIGSFFVPLTKKRSNVASANTSSQSYSFSGSNIYIPILRQDGNQFLDYLLFAVDFQTDSFNNNLLINLSRSGGFWSTNYNDGGLNFAYLFLNSDSINFAIPFSSVFGSDSLYTVNVGYKSWISSSTFGFAVSGSDVAPSSIIGVELGYILTLETYNNYSVNYVKYFDADNNYIIFYFRTLNFIPDGRLNSRTYYFVSSMDFTDNQIYQQGYNQGLADNQSNIYNNGYNAGYDLGFDRGQLKGGQEANNYSFLGLIGAVVDAPVSILSSLFNFTFLGINLWSFITSLLTIALILFVVKIFMRR